MYDYIKDLWNDFWNDVTNWATDFFWSTLASLVEYAASLVAAIPVPEFMADFQMNVSGMPDAFFYFIEPVHLPFALQLFVAAMTARVLIKFTPFANKFLD